MKLCSNCGQSVAEEIATCPNCGKEVREGRKTIDDYRIIEVLHEGYATILCRAVKEQAEESVIIRIFSPQSGVDEKIAERLKNELAELLGATELPRTEITKKLWDYVKANKLQTKTENGKPENAGKFIVADAKLLPIFKNTKSKSKSGKVTDLTNLKEGQTINMMQMAAVVGANIE